MKTDKEAVNKALELVIIEDEIIDTHKATQNQGDVIKDVFK